MPENTEVITEGTPAGEQVQDPTQQAGAGAGAEQTQTPAPPAIQPQGGQQKNIVIPTASMKRIKDEEFSRGKQSALEELAKSQGYASHADLMTALAAMKAAPAPQAPQQPQTTPPEEEDPAATLAADKEARREEGRYQRQLEKVLNERNRYAQSATDWRKKADEARAETDAIKAEMYLRTVAASTGIQDIDYAITLFSREVEKMTPEQAEQFDEKAWFSGLRSSKPLLFGEAVVPVTTGTGAGGAPKPPAPGAVAAQNGANGRTDARKMNPTEYRAELNRRGIIPGV